MQKLILGCFALCSVIDYLQADRVYAAVSGLPIRFLPPPPPFSAGNDFHKIRPPNLQDSQLVRPQRSLYGPPIHGWHGPPVQSPSIGLGHISKQELITLLEAANEVAKPAPEPEPEPEPEAEPEAGPEPGPAGPPAGTPLTVSLPAFVPIQLSAMYTAPLPPAAPGAAAPEEGPEDEDEEEPEDEDEEEEEEPDAEPEPELAPAPIKPYPPNYHPWSSRGVFSRRNVPYVVRSPKRSRVPAKSTSTKSKSRSKSRKSKSAKSKSRSKKRSGSKTLRSKKSNLRYASSAQSIQVLPPPPFLARPPGPLKLVPSNQLLSNWK